MLESLRKDSLRIFEECLKAADPEEAVHRFVHVSEGYLLVQPDTKIDLNKFDRVFPCATMKDAATRSTFCFLQPISRRFVRVCAASDRAAAGQCGV